MTTMQNIYMGLCVLSTVILILGLLNIFQVIDILGSNRVLNSVILIVVGCAGISGFYALYRYRPYKYVPLSDDIPTNAFKMPDELSRSSQNSE
jgi:uncharacterized membrane protein YuzA (DUF378 family)